MMSVGGVTGRVMISLEVKAWAMGTTGGPTNGMHYAVGCEMSRS